MSFPRGVRGISKGIGVDFSRRPANSRTLHAVISTACCKGYRLGIGHRRLPMKEHLGLRQNVTALMGHPENCGHIKAIARARLQSIFQLKSGSPRCLRLFSKDQHLLNSLSKPNGSRTVGKWESSPINPASSAAARAELTSAIRSRTSTIATYKQG